MNIYCMPTTCQTMAPEETKKSQLMFQYIYKITHKSCGNSVARKNKAECTSLLRLSVIRYHRLGGINNRNLFSCSSRGQKSKIKVLSGLISGEASLPALSSHGLISVKVERKNSGVSSSSCKDIISPIGLEPYSYELIYLYYLHIGPISKYSHIGGQGINI